MSYGILLVDDDIEFCQEFKDCFWEYRLIEARTGQQALDFLANANEIDLVLLDVYLPDTTGIKLLKSIRKSHPDLGIIIMTGLGAKDIVMDALTGKADEYIEKPINIEKTKKIIKSLIESKVEAIDIENGTMEDKLQRVKHFAARNVNNRVTLEEAAKLVFMSPKYLSRIFKESTGMNFSQYKLNIKIIESKKLLTTKGLSIEAIAYQLGYQNLESFIRIFKKYTRTTPAEYRKMNS